MPCTHARVAVPCVVPAGLDAAWPLFDRGSPVFHRRRRVLWIVGELTGPDEAPRSSGFGLGPSAESLSETDNPM